MGSQRHDIFYALEAFTDHVDRHPLDRRPAYFAQYHDIWGEARGEIGIPEPTEIDAERHKPDATVFALLTPWFSIPTIAEAWLVVDRLGDGLWVVGVRALDDGVVSPVWQVDYTLEDDGSLTPREPAPIPLPKVIANGVSTALQARVERKMWDAYYDFDTIVPVVQGMLNR